MSTQNHTLQQHLPQSTQGPLILAVETSGRTGSVAIAIGPKFLTESNFCSPMKHSAELFPAVYDLLSRFNRKSNQIEHIYLSIGPGSFTGLRIAATFAKTMHLVNNTKIVTVDTLDCIAENASDYMQANKHTVLDKIATVLDAKRGQFFIAAYQHNTSRESRPINQNVWKKILADSLMTADEFLDKFAHKQEPVWLLGEGLVYYRNKFKADGIRFLPEHCWYPKAAKVHLLGWKKASTNQFADPLTLTPTYLRAPDVKPKQKPHH